MANTGYIIYTYKDTNPYSDTYGHTKEERVYDTKLCPIVTDFDYIMRIFVNGTQTEQVDCNEVINTILWTAGTIGLASPARDYVEALICLVKVPAGCSIQSGNGGFYYY